MLLCSMKRGRKEMTSCVGQGGLLVRTWRGEFFVFAHNS
jgi:hypothetical protein